MRAVSHKRAKQLRAYSSLRLAFLEANPLCASPLDCGQAATEVHHMRGRVGALLLATEHWLGLCHGCHVYATENPLAALDLGMSERRIGRAS